MCGYLSKETPDNFYPQIHQAKLSWCFRARVICFSAFHHIMSDLGRCKTKKACLRFTDCNETGLISLQVSFRDGRRVPTSVVTPYSVQISALHYKVFRSSNESQVCTYSNTFNSIEHSVCGHVKLRFCASN